MKIPGHLFLLCFCLVALTPVAKANMSSQDNFEFLETSFDNASITEDPSALALNATVAAATTVANAAFWWGVCSMVDIASQRIKGHSPERHLPQPLNRPVLVNQNTCRHLALMIATTETALAGRVSPWPLEQSWWQPLFWIGATMAAYEHYTPNNRAANAIVATLIYLSAEALSRTGSGAVSAQVLQAMDITEADDAQYKLSQYLMFLSLTGIVTSSIINDVLINKGFRPARAKFIALVSAFMPTSLLSMMPLKLVESHPSAKSAAAIVAGVTASAGMILSARARARARARVGSSQAIAAVNAITVAGAVAGAGAGAGAQTGFWMCIPFVIGISATAGAGALMGGLGMFGLNQLAQYPSGQAIAATMSAAFAFALVNTLAAHAVYGTPFEQSLSESSQIIWKKFYAPLEYLPALFK